MDDIHAIYDALAGLLTYPGEDYRQRIAHCRKVLAAEQREALSWLDRFDTATEDLSPTQMEELFTQTFDLNPVCSLEVGWHLYGENYSRGEFLVTMRQHLRAYHLPESTELPDHLTHVLAVVCRMKLAEADTFITTLVLPAVEKMLAGLSGKDCPFESLLQAVRCVLLNPYGAVLAGEANG
jgi:nitrate reductase delta subunit